MLESKFQTKVIKYLNSKGAYVLNYNPGSTGRGGAPDVIACYKGRYIGLELKSGHKLQVRQALNLKHIHDAGGVAIVLHYSKDWEWLVNYVLNCITNGIEITEGKLIEWKKLLEEIKWD